MCFCFWNKTQSINHSFPIGLYVSCNPKYILCYQRKVRFVYRNKLKKFDFIRELFHKYLNTFSLGSFWNLTSFYKICMFGRVHTFQSTLFYSNPILSAFMSFFRLENIYSYKSGLFTTSTECTRINLGLNHSFKYLLSAYLPRGNMKFCL